MIVSDRLWLFSLTSNVIIITITPGLQGVLERRLRLEFIFSIFCVNFKLIVFDACTIVNDDRTLSCEK